MARRGRDPDRVSMAGSFAVHAVALALAWMTTAGQPALLDFTTFEIEMVSPPAANRAEEYQAPAEELVVERPNPTPSQPEPEAPEPEAQMQAPPPAEEKPAVETPPPPQEEEQPTEAATPEPPPEDVKTSDKGEDINVRMEGLRRDYPAYYGNIIRQMRRCFRWRGRGSWETTIFFVIERDGSVRELQVVQPSGNPAFDIQAMGAAECAGRGRLGPLPDDLPWERLPVQFRIRPDGSGDVDETALPETGATAR